MTIVIAIGFIFLFATSNAHAWGLMTHVELAESLLANAAIIGAGVGSILHRHRRDFMLGNLLADVIIGKKLSFRRKGCHGWSAGLRLLDNSHDEGTKAFAYGFLAHLAADTVAHNEFIPRQIVRTGSTVTLGHLYWEMMADHLTHPSHRKTVRRLLSESSEAHEELLENHLYPDLKWFGINRSIFVNVQRLTNGRKFNLAVRLCRELSLFPLNPADLRADKLRALDRMTQILLQTKRSPLLKEDPNGDQALLQIHAKRRKLA